MPFIKSVQQEEEENKTELNVYLMAPRVILRQRLNN